MPEQSAALDRALDELRRDPLRSDRLVAEAAGVSYHTVREARRRVPELATPPEERLARTGDRPADMAAGHCEHCGAPVGPTEQAGNVKRFCSRTCTQAACRRRRTQREREARAAGLPESDPEPSTTWDGPEVFELPPPPDWSRGLCTTVLPSQRCWWTSSDYDERQAALRMCADCPIRQQCEDWSMSLPTSDRAIYGGLTVNERQRRARSLRQAARESALAKAIAAQLLAQP